ncbi:GTPase Era [Sulfurospirillum cavolei]|uniref:GTPase Era n=1 Tax=Sulfurospirillum cavolei TaxID=366522 RepID=UPI000764CDF2|nr:GTPase Era [Sulfurospirillum cavolei]
MIKPLKTKAGFVAVVGRPNAGKSSLLNWLIGEKLALVSHKANATRKRLNMIAMHENAQIIFIDTPGIHEQERLLNQFMLEEAMKAMGDCDLILFLTPVTDTLQHYADFLTLTRPDVPHIVLLTKTDTVSQTVLLDKITQYQTYQDKFAALIPVSVKKGISQSYLLETISRFIPEHPYLYDPEILTTERSRDIYKELIREAIFEYTSDEVPYFSDVLIDKVEEKESIDHIYATIVVDKKSQKGIIIGKEGQTLKRIGSHARRLIEELSQKRLFLKLVVVVKQGWSQDKELLKKIGYIVE